MDLLSKYNNMQCLHKINHKTEIYKFFYLVKKKKHFNMGTFLILIKIFFMFSSKIYIIFQIYFNNQI